MNPKKVRLVKRLSRTRLTLAGQEKGGLGLRRCGRGDAALSPPQSSPVFQRPRELENVQLSFEAVHYRAYRTEVVVFSYPGEITTIYVAKPTNIDVGSSQMFCSEISKRF